MSKKLIKAIQTRVVYVYAITLDEMRALQAAGFVVIVKGRS